MTSFRVHGGRGGVKKSQILAYVLYGWSLVTRRVCHARFAYFLLRLLFADLALLSSTLKVTLLLEGLLMAMRFFFIFYHRGTQKSFVIVFSRDSLSTLRIVHNFFCHSNYNIASTFSILEKVVLYSK